MVVDTRSQLSRPFFPRMVWLSALRCVYSTHFSHSKSILLNSSTRSILGQFKNVSWKAVRIPYTEYCSKRNLAGLSFKTCPSKSYSNQRMRTYIRPFVNNPFRWLLNLHRQVDDPKPK